MHFFLCQTRNCVRFLTDGYFWLLVSLIALQARCILSLFYSNLPRERSEAAAISKTATALMFSKGSVRNVVKTWQEDGELRIVTRKGKDTKQTAPQTTAEGDTP